MSKHLFMQNRLIESKSIQITGHKLIMLPASESPAKPNHPQIVYVNEKISDQFMLGNRYLVAPVLKKGVIKRTVVFPDGKWQDMNDGTVYCGGEHEVNAPIEVLPYFLKISK